MTTREIVTAYLRAVEAQDVDEVDRLLHPEVENLEQPNKVCTVIELKDGKVWRQEPYDCFE